MRFTIQHTRRLAVAAAIIIVACGYAGTVASAEVTDENLVQQIQDAKTPEDHKALANFFNAKADAAQANAMKHESMMTVTQRGSQDVWRAHCQNLVKAFRMEASDYRALAKQQEQLSMAGMGKH